MKAKKKCWSISKRKFLEHRAAGLSDKAIAALYHVSANTVARVRDKHGIPVFAAQVGQVRDEEIRRWHALGMTDSEMAIRVQLSKTQINVHRNRLGLSPNLSERDKAAAAVRAAREEAAADGWPRVEGDFLEAWARVHGDAKWEDVTIRVTAHRRLPPRPLFAGGLGTAAAMCADLGERVGIR
ncbi:hypothetical protein [Azospirillum canadense]|uniref:hypothetical protein n=1 Tax=Azospirillum canadense TaxID=403962 RepID=UPI0022269518|nr:hypothetical protein [Azospirillum canadense]MCW2242197.1 DNA-binding CsgD family transcriptional regulator [Azospirillum canadense]